jgi:hypothetical protein
MADKDVPSIVAAIAARRSPARPWCARPSTSPGDARRRARRGLAGALPDATVREVPDPDRALDLALATGDGPVVVAGSLYLVARPRAAGRRSAAPRPVAA